MGRVAITATAFLLAALLVGDLPRRTLLWLLERTSLEVQACGLVKAIFALATLIVMAGLGRRLRKNHRAAGIRRNARDSD